jgi:LysM repeat protein
MAQKYTIDAGETLSGIASDYGISLQQLLALNPQISDPNVIFVGQVINVPDDDGSGNGNTAGGFFQWSQQARQQADQLDRFIASLNPTSSNFQLLFAQAQQLKQAAQQTQAKANSNTPDPNAANTVATLQAQIDQLKRSAASTGAVNPNATTPPTGPPSTSTQLWIGVALFGVVALFIATRD